MAKQQPRPISQEHVANVVRVVLEATASERIAGRLWYSTYAGMVAAKAQERGLTPAQGIAIFAILSQQTRLQRNWRNAVALMEDGSDARVVFASRDMRRKALAVLADAEDPGRHARGTKIRNFYANLSGDYSGVTVDRHAISVVYSRMLAKVGTDCEYEYCVRVYQAAAAILQMTPAETQAVAWVTWRRMKGITDTPEDVIA